MRVALERMPTRQYIKEQREVFRSSISAKNFHRLAELRDQSANPMAALGAVKVLEQIESQPQAMRNERPGLVVVLSAPAHQPQQLQRDLCILNLQGQEAAEAVTRQPLDQGEQEVASNNLQGHSLLQLRQEE